jgi:pSer/pThr/pTyr-binding forkhead associated (FHA) protein
MVKRYQLRGQSGPVADQIVKLVELNITLGRDLSSDVVIGDSEVSRTHARLSWQDDGYVIQDLKSTNGTWVNGRPVILPARLTAGDKVTLGKVSIFVYELIPESVTDTTRDEGDVEPPDLVESTMAMPAWQGEAMAARQVIRSRPATPQAQPEDTQPPSEQSPGRSFHRKYVACLQAGDLHGLLELYDPDATLLSGDAGVVGAVAGAQAIASFFEQYFGGLGRFGAKPTGKYVEGRDSVLCETNMETGESVVRVLDGFVLKNGKATHQFTCTVEVTSKLTK